jgi:mannose-6-phosphate isomerase-like protein (cupin superfamily)
MDAFNLNSTYLRLRSDSSVEPLPVDQTFWDRLSSGQLGEFHNEYLVSSHSVDGDWSVWEMHPNGDEVVCLLSGNVTFILETAEGYQAVELDKGGSFVVVPKGIWHTVKVSERSTMLSITAGEGTQHRAARP